MLKQRIITAVILVAIVLATLFSSNELYWRGLITLAVFVGFWEWLRFCEIKKVPLVSTAYIVFSASFYVLQKGFLPLSLMVYIACALWAVLLVFTLTDKLNFLHQPLVKLVVGMFVLSSAGSLIIEFKTISNGPLWVLCFMVAVWAADVGAYFIGRRFGKTKLAPKVSPGKTVEGLFGGVALVLVLYVPLLFMNFSFPAASLLLLTVLLTALVSVGGDLFESKLKRHVNLKDSSQVLPGHGGVLDRIDSLLSGAPYFSLGLLWLGYLS